MAAAMQHVVACANRPVRYLERERRKRTAVEVGTVAADIAAAVRTCREEVHTAVVDHMEKMCREAARRRKAPAVAHTREAGSHRTAESHRAVERRQARELTE